MRRLAEIETRTASAAIATVGVERPVYVCGMARAGTTLLLELLVATGEFTSHRYADFPFLWTPYWWNLLRARLNLRAGAPTERAHQDRMRVTFESPEAFEEIFWMHFFPHRHDPEVDQTLDADHADARFDEFYRTHVRKLLAARGAARYAAKGNYNLTRIGYLLRLFPDARFLIAIREPHAQVASLVRQDRQFCAWAQRNPGIGTQLARSGHFEFGPRKRALNVGDPNAAAEIEACFAQGRSAEGYARQWAASYGWLLERLESRPAWRAACLLVRYDALCAEPAQVMAQALAHAGVAAEKATPVITRHGGAIHAADYYPSPLGDAEQEAIERVTTNVWKRMCEMR